MRYEAAMGNVELREVTSQDIDDFFRYQSDPAASEMAAFTPRTAEAHHAHWTKILGDGNTIARTIALDGATAGNVVSWAADDRRLVGYWIGRAFWGRGAATAALGLFLEVDAHRPLHARVSTTNVGSIRVLEKCGFERAEERLEVGDDGVQEVLMVLSGR